MTLQEVTKYNARQLERVWVMELKELAILLKYKIHHVLHFSLSGETDIPRTNTERKLSASVKSSSFVKSNKIRYFILITNWRLSLTAPLYRPIYLSRNKRKRTVSYVYPDWVNSIYPDDTAHNEPSHMELRCLTFSLSTLHINCLFKKSRRQMSSENLAPKVDWV